jgi:outer membrane protein TolC
MFIRREDAERFIEDVRGDAPELAANLRIEERELEAAAQLRKRAAGDLPQPSCSAGYGKRRTTSAERLTSSLSLMLLEVKVPRAPAYAPVPPTTGIVNGAFEKRM